MVNCCVPGRTNYSAKTGSKTADISYHKFPSDKQRRKTWLERIRLSNMLPMQYSYVCSEHLKGPGQERSLDVSLKSNMAKTAPNLACQFVYTCRKLPCTYFPLFLLRILEIKYRKDSCISRTFLLKFWAKNQGCGLYTRPLLSDRVNWLVVVTN